MPTDRQTGEGAPVSDSLAGEEGGKKGPIRTQGMSREKKKLFIAHGTDRAEGVNSRKFSKLEDKNEEGINKPQKKKKVKAGLVRCRGSR